jgi:hypothetical protein
MDEKTTTQRFKSLVWMCKDRLNIEDVEFYHLYFDEADELQEADYWELHALLTDAENPFELLKPLPVSM